MSTVSNYEISGRPSKKTQLHAVYDNKIVEGTYNLTGSLEYNWIQQKIT